MKVDRIYLNIYRYDKERAKTAVASIRYWYPTIPISLIKDYGKGAVDTFVLEKYFDVEILDISRRDLGWGYGKLEPLFLETKHCFLILDADIVFTGPVLEKVNDHDAMFIVDKEIPTLSRFKEIYYNLDRVHEIVPLFNFPGYSFNSGQWFGSSGILSRVDFETTLEWCEPPKSKYPEIVYNGDQAHLNFNFHLLQQLNKITIDRIPIMVYPVDDNADFISLEAIKQKGNEFPFIIHWAGMKNDRDGVLPRQDILDFYSEYYYSIVGTKHRPLDQFKKSYLRLEKKFRHLVTKN